MNEKKFKRLKITRLTQYGIENLLFLRKLIIVSKQPFTKEIKLVIKSFPTNNTLKSRHFTGEFKQIFKEKVMPIF